MDKFQEMKKEAVTHMSILCEDTIEDSKQGMHDALACVFKHGSCRDKAKAVMIAAQWMWAHCEEAYHSAPATK